MNKIISNNYILGIGGMNMDINIKTINNLIQYDSNPSHISYSMGGVVRNILENLTRLGENTIILSSIGSDGFGDILKTESKRIGINTDYVYLNNNYKTSCYVAMIDNKNGDMYIGASDMEILEHTPIEYFYNNIDLINNSKLIIMDTNLPSELLEQVFNLLDKSLVFVDPVSISKVNKIKPYLKNIYMIKPNLLELEELCGIKYNGDLDNYLPLACDILHQEGVYEVVVSLGSDGCYYSNKDNIKLKRAFKPCKMENATGAGDSFLAGYIKGYVNNLSIEERLDYALACGIITVQSMDTISKEMNMDKVKQVIHEYKI